MVAFRSVNRNRNISMGWVRLQYTEILKFPRVISEGKGAIVSFTYYFARRKGKLCLISSHLFSHLGTNLEEEHNLITYNLIYIYTYWTTEMNDCTLAVPSSNLVVSFLFRVLYSSTETSDRQFTNTFLYILIVYRIH